jgi:hypothetical protein
MSSATVPGDCHPRGRRDPAVSGERAAPRPGRGFGRDERGRGARSRQVPETQRGSAGTDPRAPLGCGRPPATTPRPASPTRRAPYLAPPLLAFVRGPAALVDAAPPSPLPVWLGRRGGTGSLLTAAPLARARTARRRRRLPPAQQGGRGNATPPRRRRRRRQRAAGARGPEGRTTAPPAARGPALEPPAGGSFGDALSGRKARGPAPSRPEDVHPEQIWATQEEGGGSGAEGPGRGWGKGALPASGSAWPVPGDRLFPVAWEGSGSGGNRSRFAGRAHCLGGYRESKVRPLSSGVRVSDHPMDPGARLFHPAISPHCSSQGRQIQASLEKCGS